MKLNAFNKISSNIPIAYSAPLRTWISRSLEKATNIQWRHPKLRFFEAASIESVQGGLAYLKFKRTTALARKGQIVVVPNDDYMPKRVELFGYWDKKLSRFLATAVNNNTALLDLGAHCGLVSLQTFNASFVPKIYMVEPKKINLTALRKNLGEIGTLCKIKIVDAAVSDKKSKTGKLYTEPGATMNSSINRVLPSLSKNSETIEEKINTIYATQLCKNFLAWIGDSEIVLKSDLQGMDVIVLSKFSDIFWRKVLVGSIEICSLNYGGLKEINLLISKLKFFEHIFIDYDLTEEITFNELSRFYLANSGMGMNIYFKRK